MLFVTRSPFVGVNFVKGCSWLLDHMLGLLILLLRELLVWS
jgi:hypothetical protein